MYERLVGDLFNKDTIKEFNQYEKQLVEFPLPKEVEAYLNDEVICKLHVINYVEQKLIDALSYKKALLQGIDVVSSKLSLTLRLAEEEIEKIKNLLNEPTFWNEFLELKIKEYNPTLQKGYYGEEHPELHKKMKELLNPIPAFMGDEMDIRIHPSSYIRKKNNYVKYCLDVGIDPIRNNELTLSDYACSRMVTEEGGFLYKGKNCPNLINDIEEGIKWEIRK